MGGGGKCVRERGGDVNVCVSVCGREGKRGNVCVCVCVREREREKEIGTEALWCGCVCICMSVFVK
jgi:hypothetical protein